MLKRAAFPAGWQQLVMPSSSASSNQSPDAAPIEDRVSYAIQIVPLNAAVHLNPYSEADECKLRFDYSAFPFNPQIARAVRVGVHMGNVPSVDAVFEPSQYNTLFLGHADDGDWEPGEDNTINLNCRDHTSLLLDETWSGAQVDLRKPLDEIVRAVLDSSPATKPMRLELRGLAEAPVLAAGRGDAGGEGLAAKKTEKVWDVIARLMHEAGLIAYVELDSLVIAPAQTVSTDTSAPAFVYGGNLERLRIEKDISGRTVQNIMVRAWDPTTRTTLEAFYPTPKREDLTGDALPKQTKFEVYTLANVRDQAHLKQVAERIWRRKSEQEVTLELETKEMTWMESGDLLRLRAGHPVRVTISEDERRFLDAQGFDERIYYLLDRGYEFDVANSIAAAYDGPAPIYQVREATHTFDHQNGYSLRLQCGNYITV